MLINLDITNIFDIFASENYFKLLKRMNREKLQTLASEWVRIAKNDIRNKVREFMNEVNASPIELANVLTISEGEIEQILNGNGEITLTTFAKLLIATGNALEIKPIEETPIGCYGNLPSEEELRRPLPRPNIFEQQRNPRDICPHFSRHFENDDLMDDKDDDEFDGDDNEFMPPPPPNFEEFRKMMDERLGRNENATHHTTQPRDRFGRFMSNRPKREEEETPKTPFDNMSFDELHDIIVDKLWDSEIDMATASKQDLVNFLVEKDKRIKEIKRVRELENDPKVVEFKNRMKKTLEENPHLREWAKKFINE
jgi:transcriptional regulator with XRE-family HTH domain